MTPIRALLVLALVATSGLSLAQRARTPLDQEGLLEAVLKANLTLKGEGIRVVTIKFERDGKASIRQFKERVLMDGEKIRTEYTGDEQLAGQIAVDNGKDRLHYLPKENVINKSPSLQHQNTGRLEMLMGEKRKEYTVTVGEGGPVCQYPTFLITLKSPRGFTHKIWVDKRGKAILKREFAGPDPKRGTSFEFERFDYRNRIDADDFKIKKPGATVLEPLDRLALAAKKVEYSSYAVSGDPKFVLYEAGTFEAGSEKVKVLRSIYGDGKIVVTLHQFRGTIDPERLKGRDAVRTRVYVWKEDGYNFVLVGDLPAPELERLARLVRR
jgi:outer membrane lipoprotein-sorting protein